MSNIKPFIEKLLLANGVTLTPDKSAFLDAFISDEKVIEQFNVIQQNQTEMVKDYVLRNKINDIIHNHMQIPNGTVGKNYETIVDFNQLGWNELIHSEFVGLEECGLSFDSKNDTISGIPTTSGEYKIKFLFKVDGESENAPLNEKNINLIINDFNIKSKS